MDPYSLARGGVTLDPNIFVCGGVSVDPDGTGEVCRERRCGFRFGERRVEVLSNPSGIALSDEDGPSGRETCLWVDGMRSGLNKLDGSSTRLVTSVMDVEAEGTPRRAGMEEWRDGSFGCVLSASMRVAR